MQLNTVKDLRTETIEAAYREFAGTGEISMRRLGESLEVSATALYHHFKNKDALLEAVAERAFAAFEKRLRSIESKTARETIREVLARYRQFAADHTHLFGLMFVSRRPGARKFPRDFAAHRSQVFNLLWKAVDETMGADRPSSSEGLYIAHDLWALAHGQILLWRAGRFENEEAFVESFDKSIDRFLRSL